MAHAFLSNRVVMPHGTQPAALLVEAGRIRAICRASELPADTILHDCGNDAILPGLVDTHVHINQPGRTEWEGFRNGVSHRPNEYAAPADIALGTNILAAALAKLASE